MYRGKERAQDRAVSAPRVLTPQRALLAVLVFFGLLGALLAHPPLATLSIAQTETNTTVTNATVTNTTIISIIVKIANVSVTQPPLINIQPRFVNSSTVEVAIQCVNPLGGACPLVRLVLGHGSQIYYNNTVNVTCTEPQCIQYLYVTVNNTQVWVFYSYREVGETYSQNITITYFVSTYPQYVTYIISMIPFALLAALIVRSNPVAAGLGAIAAGIGIYILGSLGYVPYNLTLVNIAILVGALILYVSGR